MRIKWLEICIVGPLGSEFPPAKRQRGGLCVCATARVWGCDGVRWKLRYNELRRGELAAWNNGRVGVRSISMQVWSTYHMWRALTSIFLSLFPTQSPVSGRVCMYVEMSQTGE